MYIQLLTVENALTHPCRREAAEKQQELSKNKPWWKPWGSGE